MRCDRAPTFQLCLIDCSKCRIQLLREKKGQDATPSTKTPSVHGFHQNALQIGRRGGQRCRREGIESFMNNLPRLKKTCMSGRAK